MVENALSMFQCDFCKTYSTQHGLVVMTEKTTKNLNKVWCAFNRYTKILQLYDT